VHAWLRVGLSGNVEKGIHSAYMDRPRDKDLKKGPEVISLRRGGSVISSLASAFGGGLRETRLTALLGYLIALDPEPWMPLFGFPGTATEVMLENCSDEGRSDIEVRTERGTGIIEAKVDSTNPIGQARRYTANWRVLLTQYKPINTGKHVRGTRYLCWHDLAECLQVLTRSQSPATRFLASDLITYLEEHHMISKADSVEVYAREINGEDTLALFLQARIYKCLYEKGSRLPRALYFAPHFGQRIAKKHPGVHVGISYIARIEGIDKTASVKGWKALMRSRRSGFWLRKHEDVIDAVARRTTWDGKEQSVLFLGEPRQVFIPAIRKDDLQAGKGWLSKRFFSFDELYAAWGS